MIDSVILASFGTSLRGIAQKCALGLNDACSPLYQQELCTLVQRRVSITRAVFQWVSWELGGGLSKHSADRRPAVLPVSACSLFDSCQFPGHISAPAALLPVTESPLTVASKRALCHTHAHVLLFSLYHLMSAQNGYFFGHSTSTIDLSLFILHAHVFVRP